MKAHRGNIGSIITDIEKRKQAALAVAAQIVQTAAKDLVPVGKYPSGSGMVGGALRNSIMVKVESDHAKIGTNMVYAAMQEFGGVVTPVKAGALTIPLIGEAYGRKAEDFNDLFIMESDGKAFLARKVNDEIQFVYILLKSVEIPKQPYLRPALRNSKNKIMKILQAG